MKTSTIFISIIVIIAVIAIIYAGVSMKPINSTNTTNNTNTTTNTTNNTNTSMQFETYGGFIAPAFYRHVLTINETNIDYTVFAQNGSVTDHKLLPSDMPTFNSMLRQFQKSNFTSLNTTYKPQHPNPDIGSTNISLTIDGFTKSVFIKQGFDGTPYPDSLTGIIESMQSLIPQ